MGKDRKITEAASEKYIFCPVKGVSDPVGGMGIGSQGNDLAAQLSVPGEDLFAGIRLLQTVVNPSGIQLEPDPAPDELRQESIQNLCMVRIAEIRVTGQKKDERGYLTDQLFRLMAAMDAPIRRMEPERDDLETVFLEAVNQPSP